MTVYEQEIDNKEKGEPALIIAADTVVVGHFGEILEKPRSEREHIDMLKGLRDGGEHKVFTAVVCMRPLESAMEPGYAIETHVEDTTVKFDTTGTSAVFFPYRVIAGDVKWAERCGKVAHVLTRVRYSHGRVDPRVRQDEGGCR